ncbi:MAG: fatty acid desaturase [Myxococcales bacterium]|nr:fatty acid desaturase [Myxococcales bacterium]
MSARPPHSRPPFDPSHFARDLDAIRATLEPLRTSADLRYMQALHWACWLAVAVALALSVWGFNPLSPLLFALAASTRWMVLGHHVCHGALDALPETPRHWRSAHFARGAWRWLQWPDWLDPAAWCHEHNQLHHAYTNDPADPDVPQLQARWLRDTSKPLMLRYLVVLLVAVSWRWLYYAPNTASLFANPQRKMRTDAEPLLDRASREQLWDPRSPAGRQLWLRSWLPYLGFTYGLMPLLVLPWGLDAWAVALVHLMVAEALCSAHTFAVIVPNHAGDDLPLFEGRARGKGQWYRRQILSSCNYTTGGAINDWLHGYLNYQIEHHLWPDLTPRQYVQAAPLVRAVCAQHGVAYVQHSLWRRVGKLIAVLTGAATQRVDCAALPILAANDDALRNCDNLSRSI